MGGKAFAHANPPLETPRMPHAAYLEAKNTVIRRLSKKFHWINVPMEGPGKEDHGDVDVLVCEMNGIDILKESVLDAISDALGAESRIIAGGASHFAAHFAIPWPEHIPIPQAKGKATLLPPVVSITPPSPPGPYARSSLTITPGNLFKPSGDAPAVSTISTATRKPPLDSTLPSPFGPHPNPLGSNPALYIKEASSPDAEPNAEEYSKSNQQTFATTAVSQTMPPSNDSDGVSITSSERSQASAATAPVTGKWGTISYLKRKMKTGESSSRSFSLSTMFKRGKSGRDSVASNSTRGTLEKINSSSSEPGATLPAVTGTGPFRIKRRTVPKSILTDNPFVPLPTVPVHENQVQGSPRIFIQVDVRYCLSRKQAKYLRFFESHGDFWQILGPIIRPYGLTVDDKGLHIRVPEGEQINRKKAKILLTSKPDDILLFLGLPVAEYWRPFATTDAMFKYITKCPMFSLPRSSTLEGDMSLGTSNDRRRMASRPVYREWVQEFKPRLRERGQYYENPLTRDDIRDKAFNTFKIESEYHSRVRSFIRDSQRDELRKYIRSIVPQAEDNSTQAKQRRSKTIKAMLAIVLDGLDASEFGIAAPSNLLRGNGTWDMPRTKDWIRTKVHFIGRYANMSATEKEKLRAESTKRKEERG
ncbi:uncharacterized protein FMAN_12743 [Fusarium mangiferae]|uniref:Uncharacterized protein n=1 Tax=Fusarium mangiferae TaxID=192010 RepID=A0A1L7U684_FUSMA|nr:uncharacterized protein FMAN_12743 [Fusarium mangiferae]CVL04632.1 uncharacterized protein FMAN_12743 [Fusarium mangiferae]